MNFCFCNFLLISHFFPSSSLSLSQVFFHNFFDLHNFFLTSSTSFFSKKYVFYTGSKDETVRIRGIFRQVIIFFFFLSLYFILLVVLVWKCTFLFYINSSKVKCRRGIITTNVIVFIFRYIYIYIYFFFFFWENNQQYIIKDGYSNQPG